MLVTFGGLPGSGKTALARRLAQSLSAVYLRIDTIENALIQSGVLKEGVGPAGYVTAYRLAEENLSIGRIVVADSVNALQITRESWKEVAQTAQVLLAEVEVRCSDLTEHRRRIESRHLEIEALPSLTWHAVANRPYEPWPTDHIVIETAGRSVLESEIELSKRLTEFRSLAG